MWDNATDAGDTNVRVDTGLVPSHTDARWDSHLESSPLEGAPTIGVGRFTATRTVTALWGELLRRSKLVDLVVAAVTVLVGLLLLFGEAGEADPEPTVAGFVFVLASGPLLVFRRVNALLVLIVVAAGGIGMLVSNGSDAIALPAMSVALYTTARWWEERRNLVYGGAVGLTYATLSAAIETPFSNEWIGNMVVVLFPLAVGEIARTRAARIQSRVEAQTKAKVEAERRRVAQDLHDVVANGLSVIAVQSGVAAHLLDRDIDQARKALEAINAVGKRSLEDLRDLVGLLRSSEEINLVPTPADPDDFSSLTERAGQAGVTAQIEMEGCFPDDVPDASVVAVHRIIGEALTNVARHAGAVPALVTIRHGDDEVGVEVRNNRSAMDIAPVASTRVGVIGMTERAETLGGTLRAGPTTGGGFEVVALIPYRRRTR